MTGALLAFALFDRIEEFVRERFSFSTGNRGAVFLIWGGLLLIGVVLATGLLHSRVIGADPRPVGGGRERPAVITRVPPPRPRPAGAARSDAALSALREPEREYQKGRLAGKKVRARHVDALLDRFRAADLGEPRILSSEAGRRLIRVYDCRTCGGLDRPLGSAVCEFERGFLASAFESLAGGAVRVAELHCRGRGHEHCEFEVTYR